MILLWISVILSFFSLSFALVRAQKRVDTLTTRIEIFETSLSLQERDITELKRDVEILYSTESVSSTVEENIKSLESEVDTLQSEVDTLREIVGKPRDESYNICDQLDVLTELSEIEHVRVEDLDFEVKEIIKQIPLKISVEEGRRY